MPLSFATYFLFGNNRGHEFHYFGIVVGKLEGVLDKHLYTYKSGIYLLDFITAHVLDLLMPVKVKISAIVKSVLGIPTLLLLSLFFPKKKIGYSEERDLSGQARGGVVLSRRRECFRSLPKVWFKPSFSSPLDSISIYLKVRKVSSPMLRRAWQFFCILPPVFLIVQNFHEINFIFTQG